MKVELNWLKKMKFEAHAESQSLQMDAKRPIGEASAMTPKELLAAGLGGCTGMDVISLLKLKDQNHHQLKITVDIQTSQTGQPVVFTGAVITFSAIGAIDQDVLLNAVQLSQTKYCGVSAMLSKAFPIEYRVELNGEEIGRGKSAFT